MAKKKKFPKVLYVAIESDGSGAEEWFVADDSPEEHAVMNGERKVAVYELKEIRALRNITEMK